jgi:hypothetical protein
MMRKFLTQVKIELPRQRFGFPITWPHSFKIAGQCVPDSPFLLPSKIVQRVINAPAQRIRMTEPSQESDKSKSDRLSRARVLTLGRRTLAAELLSLLGAVDFIIGKSLDHAAMAGWL